MLNGNQEGINVWYKLGQSEDGIIKEYVSSIRQAAQRHESAYFSDLIEQLKKPLNNQTVYCLHLDLSRQWSISLFHKPTNLPQ
jgi:hypothetical protein